jgi:hypothetical protein
MRVCRCDGGPVAVVAFCNSDGVRIEPRDAGRIVHGAGLTLVGERHGTWEFPRLVTRLAIAAAEYGPLIVAIELDDDAREPTSRYLLSSGSADDRRELLRTRSWQRNDGRASQAMFEMIDTIRQLVDQGASIEIDVFDVPTADTEGTPEDETRRDRLIAERLQTISQRSTTLALTGNVHAELTARPDAPIGFIPAAAIIAAETPLLSLIGRHAGGESWCTLLIDGHPESRAHPVTGADRGPSPFIHIDPTPEPRRGTAYVGRITPSPPAAMTAPG